jgi:MoaA/NifB/PqqE/SkfB family radical SAM enzyme
MRRFSLRKFEDMYQGPPELWPKQKHNLERLFDMLQRQVPRLNPNVRKKLAVNMLLNNFHLSDKTRFEYQKKHGEWPPCTLVISPSMKCGLRCFGCYAWEYDKSKELTREEVIDVIHQAKEEMGIHFYTITGGEPTQWEPLFDVARHHGDCVFNTYTHGMLIDDDMADRIAEAGNIYPSISIEGDPALTDQRRGEGAYEKVIAAMQRLYDRGCLYGFSCTHTNLNHEYVTSEKFLDDMIEKGCAYGWFFQYVLTGKDPTPELVPTAEQRKERYFYIWEMRSKKPILIYDFWNDGELVSGCMAWGRKYLHVTASGMVEPCVFLHMAKDNIRDKKLVDIINSPVFKEARNMQPFNCDHRRPCPIIDNMDVLPYLHEKWALEPTHKDAERILTDLREFMCQTSDSYAKELEELDRQRAEMARAE